MNELSIEVKQQQGVIECNFDELKEALAVQMTAYTDLEITEGSIKEAKADLATLRKIRKALDDKRKEVKKDFMKPYDSFESRAKELLGVIDEPIDMIDGKLKGFEEKRIAEKQAHLHDLYEQNIGELAEFIPYDRIATDKWNNATYKDKDVISDISEAKTVVMSELSAIRALNSEIEEEIINAYKASGNSLEAAIKKNSDYMAAKQLAEQKVKEEAEQSAQEEAKNYEPQRFVETVEEDLAVANEVVDTLRIEIIGKDDIEKAKMILSLEDISYREI